MYFIIVHSGDGNVDKPCQEFRDGLGAEDWRLITICYTVVIRLNIFIGDDRNHFLECLSIGVTIEIIELQVFNVCISREDFSKNSLLDLINVGHNLFNKLKKLLV